MQLAGYRVNGATSIVYYIIVFCVVYSRLPTLRWWFVFGCIACCLLSTEYKRRESVAKNGEKFMTDRNESTENWMSNLWRSLLAVFWFIYLVFMFWWIIPVELMYTGIIMGHCMRCGRISFFNYRVCLLFCALCFLGLQQIQWIHKKHQLRVIPTNKNIQIIPQAAKIKNIKIQKLHDISINAKIPPFIILYILITNRLVIHRFLYKFSYHLKENILFISIIIDIISTLTYTLK